MRSYLEELRPHLHTQGTGGKSFVHPAMTLLSLTPCNVVRAENAAHAWPYKVFPSLYALGEHLTYSATHLAPVLAMAVQSSHDLPPRLYAL